MDLAGGYEEPRTLPAGPSHRGSPGGRTAIDVRWAETISKDQRVYHGVSPDKDYQRQHNCHIPKNTLDMSSGYDPRQYAGVMEQQHIKPQPSGYVDTEASAREAAASKQKNTVSSVDMGSQYSEGQWGGSSQSPVGVSVSQMQKKPQLHRRPYGT